MRKIFFLTAVSILLILLVARGALAAIGETYDQMSGKYGAPEQISLGHVVRAKDVSRYEAAGAKGYLFKISGFNVYAVFNENNVCFRMFTMRNRTLPNPVVLVGVLANTTPMILWREPLRALKLQYGSGDNAVIYISFGLPEDLSAEAYSEALSP